MINIRIHLGHTLFLDVETVSAYSNYEQMPEAWQKLWTKKASALLRFQTTEEPDDSSTARLYKERAAIYAEFGKIVCISVGFVRQSGPEWTLRIKSFADEDERTLLESFKDLLLNHFGDPNRHFLCGHNIKEFDIPYICRRMLVNRIALPPILDITGRKPWEVGHLIDTMQLWKFGDFKNFTSLDVLSHLFDIPSPKENMDGSEVGTVYWDEGDLNKICRYCELDVKATMQVLMTLTGTSYDPALFQEQ